MRLLVALMVSLMAGAASADGVAPRSDVPDVVYIGEGWPANLTNGCFDRGECQLPEIAKAAKPANPVGRTITGRGFLDSAGSGCSGALHAGGDIAAAYATVARCLNGG
jgi:hypothetical protein